MTRNDIISFCRDFYGTEPDYPWESTPDAFVERHPKSRKWYLLLMSVSPKHLGLEGEKALDIINLKVDPLMAGSLRMSRGIMPAYHMNKEKWISVLLDGSVDDEQIKDLINISYMLTK